MLTQAHVRALRDHPSPNVRADIAEAVSRDFATGRLNPAETDIAERILEGLAHDVASTVRQTLADNIRTCPFLPYNVAVALAHDLEDSVALPIIEYSPLLSTADLIAVIRSQDIRRQIAVARRRPIGEPVSDELVETGNSHVVRVLLANEDAEISENSLVKVAVRFRDDTEMQELLVDRSLLPFAVCGLLMDSVSVELRRRLVEKHQIPDFMADEMINLGRERALVDLLPSYDSDPSETLAFELQQRDLLTPMLLLRTLCVGDMRFFESALSLRSGVPLINVKTLLSDWGKYGFRALYQKANLPEALFSFFRIGVTAMLHGHLEQGRSVYTDHIIEQFVIYDNNLSPGTLEQILAELAHRIAHDTDARMMARA